MNRTTIPERLARKDRPAHAQRPRRAPTPVVARPTRTLADWRYLAARTRAVLAAMQRTGGPVQ